MFRTVPLSVISSLALYTQQQVYVIQVLLTVLLAPASKTVRGTVRNM